MDEFYIKFNIFGKYSDFESWQKAELSPIKKRKRGESSKVREAKRRRFGKLFSLLKNTEW